jgi:hypothetical protein
MKKKLNILCVIVMLVLTYSVIDAAYYVGTGFKAGIELGSNKRLAKVKKQELMHLQVVSVLPKHMSNILSDSIYNAKTGKYIPVSYGQLAISVDTHPSMVVRIMSALASLTDFIVTIWAVVLFIRIIIAINKSDIFNWRNVRRIRRLGIMLIIGFSCTLFVTLLTAYSVKEVFASDNYSLYMTDMVKITSLVLGITAFIVAEVFAIGLKMKEDQDLTI